VHTRKSPFNPSFVDLKFFDDSGLDLPMGLEKNIENFFFREDFVGRKSTIRRDHLPGGRVRPVRRRVPEIRGRESHRREALHHRLDYSYGSSSLIFPRILGQLGWRRWR